MNSKPMISRLGHVLISCSKEINYNDLSACGVDNLCNIFTLCCGHRMYLNISNLFFSMAWGWVILFDNNFICVMVLLLCKKK